jgi:hypothetical protein
MKSNLALIVLIFLGNVAFAQTNPGNENQPPSETPGEYGTPRKPRLEDQKEDRMEISKEKLPPLMLQELENNPRYEGWEEGNVFYEQNTDQFIVHVKRDNTTQTFRFDKEGRPLKNNESLDVPDKKN